MQSYTIFETYMCAPSVLSLSFARFADGDAAVPPLTWGPDPLPPSVDGESDVALVPAHPSDLAPVQPAHAVPDLAACQTTSVCACGYTAEVAAGCTGCFNRDVLRVLMGRARRACQLKTAYRTQSEGRRGHEFYTHLGGTGVGSSSQSLMPSVMQAAACSRMSALRLSCHASAAQSSDSVLPEPVGASSSAFSPLLSAPIICNGAGLASGLVVRTHPQLPDGVTTEAVLCARWCCVCAADRLILPKA